MEDRTNPFSEEYVDDSNGDNDGSNEESSLEKPPIHPTSVTVDAIAEYLLNKQYILTALELHTEILENGKELPRLRNYFSNPAHFELQANFRDSLPSGSLFRTGSCSTFDSLDLTRYSDDGAQQDDRVAVLEFELRKAKETIQSLRTNLTDAVEPDSFLKSPANGQMSVIPGQQQCGENLVSENTPSDMKPLEKRALNYLVNEYLLQSEYKLTSITLADENEDQDFEDWDDVGLNMPKPPNLLKLYREYSAHATPKHSCNVGVGTRDCLKQEESKAEDLEIIDTLRKECERLEKENSELNIMITQLQEDLSRQASIVTSTPSKPNNELEEDKAEQINGTPVKPPNKSTQDGPHGPFTKSDSSSTLIEETTHEKSCGDRRKSSVCNSEAILEDMENGSNHNTHNDAKPTSLPLPGRMSVKFWEALLLSFYGEIEETWLSTEVTKIASSCDDLVLTLSTCLPKIVPTVLLQKRDQLLPLLLCTAAMHSDPKVRNEILHDLFNLIKKPDKNQRQMIISGCIAYAKHVGPMRTEEDLLPQCWEQIGHKYTERRHLVAEACGAISPYLRAEMRSSLLLSILQQMQQEERSEEVRQAVVKSLSIVFALLEDDDKYNQAFELLLSFLGDSSLSVKEAAKECLLPSFASWARQQHKLLTHLFNFSLSSIESTMPDVADDKEQAFDETQFVDSVESLHVLLPHLFVYLLTTMPTKYKCNKDGAGDGTELREGSGYVTLCDPSVIMGSEEEYGTLLTSFDATAEIADFESWDAMSWCLNELIPRLLKIMQKIGPQYEDSVGILALLFNKLCLLFGRNFLDSKLEDQFKTLFTVTGKDVDHRIFNEETPLTSAAVAVYASGVLATFKEKPRKERLSAFLKETLTTLACCHSSLESVKAAFIDIRKKDPSLHELLLDTLWSTAKHSSSYVRAGGASVFVVLASEDVDPKIISTKLLPTLITLSTDVNSDVRTAAIPALGAVVECSHVGREVVDCVITQMTTFMAPSHHDSDEAPEQQLPSHSMNVQLVQTMAQVSPKAHPKFRDEFILPHLAATAASNNQATNKTKRSDIALELLDAFTNVSCCFISDGLLQSAFLPGVRCLLVDMEKLHPEHVAAVNKLIKDKETKLEKGSIASSGSLDNSSVTSEKSATKSDTKRFYNKLF